MDEEGVGPTRVVAVLWRPLCRVYRLLPTQEPRRVVATAELSLLHPHAAREGRGAPSLAAPSSFCTDDFGTRFSPVGIKERF